MNTSIPYFSIFMDNSKLILIHTDHLGYMISNNDQMWVEKYKNPNQLQDFIEILENKDGSHLIVHNNDLEELWKVFQSRYSLISAAGGLVTNSKDKILFIYRRKMWDLPKGKMEKGEEIADTAMREVQEECGLNKLELVHFLVKTYHTYQNRKGDRKLKTTYWYHMKSDDKPIPQTEEDIELCEYLSLKEFMDKPRKVYTTIWQVIDKFQLITK